MTDHEPPRSGTEGAPSREAPAAGPPGPSPAAGARDTQRAELPASDQEPELGLAKNAPGGEPASETPLPEDTEPPEKDESKFYVVGVGASAGGLEAVGELLKHVPVDGMTFIVVQHLAPHHESLLAQLLARNVRLKVITAADGMTLEASRVYVIPPNADLAVLQGVIRLIAPSGASGPHLPIDYLFRSLAEDQGHRAIGVVLSGTGTDGTFGLEAIKAAGGLAFVQDPGSAKYDGMPRSALASGAADFCLSPEAIGAELTRIAQRPAIHVRPRAHERSTHVQDQLAKLFVVIRSEFGVDLTQYKQSMVDRRIERRMMLHKIARLEEYVKYAQSSREELAALYKDMLITVTSFFRDRDAFEALKSTVFPHILERKEASAPVRVWVPACASGEEAYSIAICLMEACEEKARDVPIQIFGTDVDDDAIQVARRGVYPENIKQDVSPERLARFFIKTGGDYQISRRVRDVVVFSKQNILKDAPFSRMHLVSCRNLLIYLQPPAQKKVLRVLHYALQPAGSLLLGSSETVGDAPDLFSLVDRKNKIYAKKPAAPYPTLDASFGVPASPPGPVQAPLARPTLSLQGVADRKVIELYGPPGVVINERSEILQFRGHTGPFLDPAPGAASFNLLRLARFELQIELKGAISRVLAEQQRVTKEVSFEDDGERRAVLLDVVPLLDPDTKARCFLVLFHRMPPPKDGPVIPRPEAVTEEAAPPLLRRIHELEHELAVTREFLQTSNEEKESTLEELKSANEELQSSNEELQSTNEELETSKEEMQSTNEELTTVNEELHTRMAELSQTNDDLHNVLTGIDNAVVIVGMDLRIRRYTAAGEKLFNLVPGDVGRSIGFLDPFIGAGAIEPKVSGVIQSLTALSEELLASNHKWYELRIRPYKTLDHSIRGALVTLIDIDVRKRAAELTRDVGAYADRFLAPIGHPLLIVDRQLRIAWCNDLFLSRFQVTREETVGSLLATVGGRHFADPGLRERVAKLFASGSGFRDYEMPIRSAAARATVKVGAALTPISTEAPLALLSIEPGGEVLQGAPP